jgi:hypothetical protein
MTRKKKKQFALKLKIEMGVKKDSAGELPSKERMAQNNHRRQSS